MQYKEDKNLQEGMESTVSESNDVVESVATEENDNKVAKKRKPKKENAKMKNIHLAKRNTYALIFTVVLVAVLVLVNLLSTLLAQRLPTTIDVTTDRSNSLTPENIEFIKGIDKEVELIVCATREGYTGSEMVNYAYNNYFVQENSTPYNYFNQTVVLLESYSKYNKNIKVKYVDPQTPSFNALESDSDISIQYGDILVRCSREVDGKEKSFVSVITFEDIYELYDSSNGGAMYGMGVYTIVSSNIESELSGAIYTVAASKKANIALLTGHAEKGAADTLLESLEGYNFEVQEIESTLTTGALKDVQMVLLVSPVSDLSASELRVLDAYLDNNGKRGKSFLVFGNTAAPATPNLNQFMEEWGIRVLDGMAYETNAQYRDKNDFFLFQQKNEMTASLNETEKLYLSGNNVALEQAYEENGSRVSHVLMQTSPYAVEAPVGTKAGYTPPSSAKQKEMPIIMITADSVSDANYEDVSSYVGYFASVDFIDEKWFEYDVVGNMEYAITVINATAGRDSSGMYFLPKITGVTSMTLSDAQKATVRVVCMYVVPVLVLIGGVLVWLWRKNR